MRCGFDSLPICGKLRATLDVRAPVIIVAPVKR